MFRKFNQFLNRFSSAIVQSNGVQNELVQMLFRNLNFIIVDGKNQIVVHRHVIHFFLGFVFNFFKQLLERHPLSKKPFLKAKLGVIVGRLDFLVVQKQRKQINVVRNG